VGQLQEATYTVSLSFDEEKWLDCFLLHHFRAADDPFGGACLFLLFKFSFFSPLTPSARFSLDVSERDRFF